MEMIHMMIKYPEVYTDLTLISIPTIPLEIWAEIEKVYKDAKPTDVDVNDEDTSEDGSCVGIILDNIRRALNLPEWRQHTQPEILLLDEMKLLAISISKINQ